MKTAVSSRLLPDAASTGPTPVYLMGQRIRLEAHFTDDVGNAADPTAVVLTVIDAAGVASVLATANPAVGSYTADLDVPAAAASAGVWAFRFEGSGTVVAAGEARFEVSSSTFYV